MLKPQELRKISEQKAVDQMSKITHEQQMLYRPLPKLADAPNWMKLIMAGRHEGLSSKVPYEEAERKVETPKSNKSRTNFNKMSSLEGGNKIQSTSVSPRDQQAEREQLDSQQTKMRVQDEASVRKVSKKGWFKPGSSEDNNRIALHLNTQK